MNEANEELTERKDETELDNPELDSVAGGIVSPRDPQSGIPTGK